MEFEKNTSVSDEQRRLAETKKLTLEPVHNDVAPEDISDSQVVAQHLMNPAIENAPNDIEQSKRVVTPAKSTPDTAPQTSRTPKSSTKIIAGAVILLCVAVTAGVLLMVQK